MSAKIVDMRDARFVLYAVLKVERIRQALRVDLPERGVD
jgi:hypothetical protein